MINEQLERNYIATYPELAVQLPGHDLLWLQALRNSAFLAFNKHGFPQHSQEDWRYSPWSNLSKTSYMPSVKQDVATDWLDSYRLASAWHIVFLNGRYSPQLSSLIDLDSGLEIQSVPIALKNNPTDLQALLGKAVLDTEHSLIAFNNAWFADGFFIQLPANCQLAKPIQILHVVTEDHALAVTRNVIVLQQNARAEIIETFIGSSESYFTNAVTEVFLHDNSELSFSKLQHEASKAMHFAGIYVKQAQHSRFKQYNFALGSQQARTDIETELQTAAECSLDGLFVGIERQQLDNFTRIKHLKPHAISRQFYKGVLNDKSRGVFQGRVIVEKAAQQTDSQMNNRNLLLSTDAEVDSKPQLEIYADDVKCAHGVTVGQLEENAVFYLQSRGLDADNARHLLSFAFANEMVDKVENEALKTLLVRLLLDYFPGIKL